MIPFLKWVGGKRWFINKHVDLVPQKYDRYIEPFLGSGTVFFYLQPSKAILGDLNSDLISTYQAIKDNWKAVDKLLQIHHKNHNQTYYYQVRNEEKNDLLEKAARFIYLNRTCFNGIYRV